MTSSERDTARAQQIAQDWEDGLSIPVSAYALKELSAAIQQALAEVRAGMVTLRALQDINSLRVKRWHPGGLSDWSPLEWAGAMAGEAGEACNAAKKLKRITDQIANINTEEGRSLTDHVMACEKIGEEVADTIIYGVLLAAAVGVDIEDAVIRKFNQKSEEYGFPERLARPTPARREEQG